MPWLRLLLAAALIAGCSDNKNSGPFDGLPLDGIFPVGVSAPVHVARDRFGVAHISAQTIADAAFVQGYVMAHDRLPQMDILRRVGAGTLAELFGALDPTVIDSDLEMRVHRMKPLAEEALGMLQASADPTDVQVVNLLEQFSRGVNQYVVDLRSGKWTIDPDVAVSFDADRFADWTPVDSLVLGRFQAFALSYSAPFEIDATELYQKLRATYDNATPANPANYARRGIAHDLLRFTPVGKEPTIPGFPNVPDDTGSRSDGSDASPRRSHASPQVAANRPTVPQALLDQARSFFTRDIHTGPFGALGAHAFMFPHAGSNNWAVGPGLAAPLDGRPVALLATDQHLQLPNPSIFYPTHLIVADADGNPATSDPLDVLGVTFPGIPGVILGTNGAVAWSATVSEHDVNDVYLESISPCVGGGDCVAWTQPVQIQHFTEKIDIGALGTITGSQTATYELVPHHGPIVPAIDHATHQIIPRTANSALSIRYTGYQPTFEIRALYKLARAKTVHEGFAALADFTYGSQNWTMIDDRQTIGWTTQAQVPVRKPAAYTWDAKTNPDGLAPFFVLPGDGTADWQPDGLSTRVIPHAIDPPQGYLATANADPVGATFDDNPLNQGMVDGQPLYAGVTYAAGVREERITKLVLAAATAGVTLDDMATIQHDTHSNIGEKLAPALRAALDGAPGAPSDVAPYLASLPAADRTRLATARQLIDAWTFATPAAVTGPNADSAATCVFNVWMHFFIERSIKDELDAIGFDVYRLDDNFIVRIIYGLLASPGEFVPSATTGQPVLCDRIATAGADDSCTKLVLMAMVDAMTHLESAAGFGTTDTGQWRWGELHRLKITPLFPNHALDLPAPTDPDPRGFPKAGDNFVVNRSDQGWSDLDFAQYADGPAQRFLALAAGGDPIKVKWQLPGGVIFDKRSPHYRDLLDRYYLPEQHFDAPFSIDEIVAAGESRWVFR